MGISAFCYIRKLFGVVLFQGSMLDWRKGWGQSAMGLYAYCFIGNFFSVVVLHRSIVD